MPFLTSAANVATRRLPKLLSPDAHRAADYLVAGSLIAAGAFFWRRNRRAALASWVSGGSLLGLSALTSYPGRPRRHLAFHAHGQIETGVAAMVAAMPEFFHFEDEKQRHFFALQAVLLTAVSRLTAFSEKPSRRLLR